MMTRKRHFRHLLTTGWQLQAGVCGFKDLDAKKARFLYHQSGIITMDVVFLTTGTAVEIDFLAFSIFLVLWMSGMLVK